MEEMKRDRLLDRIARQYPYLSKGQKHLSDFIRDNYQKAAFLTAAKLGEIVGVSESTVVRFATSLGYAGYPDFHKALEELARNRLNSLERMEVTSERVLSADILDTVLQADIETIRQTMASIDQKAFDQAVALILQAKRIYVLGIRSSAPLAAFFCFYLNLICENVTELHGDSAGELFEQMLHIKKEDVVIGISFPRYSTRTRRALEFAAGRKAKIITLTDSPHAPINAYSDCKLIAKSDMISIVDSIVAPLSVINALLAALSMKRKKEVAKTLQNLEALWGEFQVYQGESDGEV